MIQFSKHAGIYTLEARQELPISLEKAWDFFSDPRNLERITPKDLGFNILSKVDKRAYAGQIITYKIQLFPMITTNWVTEITQVNEPHFFIDEQRFGPYAMWHHEHWFEPTAKGTAIIDKVSYKLPLAALGRIMHPIFIKAKLKHIFTARRQALDELFA